jgi:hypothetical protein
VTRAHRQLVLLTAVLALAGIALGCAKSKRVMLGNLPPETSLFVQGAVDTVNHRIHVYWFGTDPDGEVVAYAFRWVYPPPSSQNPKWDTLACALPGRCTDSLFTLQTGDSDVVSPRFEIYAIDNQGAPDPTPAEQTFLLSNQGPTVIFTNPLSSRDTTYGSVTASWAVNDPDGGGPGQYFRVWLDGNEASYDSTSEFSFTVPTSRFLTGGTYVSGPRTLFVQAVDDGGRSGTTSEFTWYVRAPAATLLPDHRGKLLIIDDIPSNGNNNGVFDAFYLAALTGTLGDDEYSVLRPQFNPGIFRSASDFAQTLRQFKAVLWYRGQEVTASTLLQTYQGSLAAYLDHGGSLYIDGAYLIQGLHSPGWLREDFLSHLGSNRFIYSFNTAKSDSTAGWGYFGGARNGSFFRSSAYGDTLRSFIATPVIRDSSGSARGFAVRDTNYVALWAMKNQLLPVNPDFELAIGVTVPQPGGGRLVFLTMPLRGGAPIQAANLLKRMLFGYGTTPGVVQ